MEVWVNIPGYVGYEVSNMGNVRSVDRLIEDKLGRKRFWKGKPLKPLNCGKGYLAVNLNNDKRMYIHVLVAMGFAGHEPNGHKVVVDHINGDKKDNRLENINVTTQRQNVLKGDVCKSEYPGTYYCTQTNKWRARKMIDGKRYNVGYYETQKEAFYAYIDFLL